MRNSAHVTTSPTADGPIFVCLLGAIGVMCCFGFLLYWLMQPTILPSKEFVQVPLRPAVVVLAPPHVAEENERVSLALAKEENAKQGLGPMPVATAALPEPKPEPSRVKSEKSKQVAKVKKRDRTPTQEPRSSWANATHRGNIAPIFGGLFR